MGNIKALKYEAGKREPEEIEIETSLENLQAAVGGWIEILPLGLGENLIICDEEGLLAHKQFVRGYRMEEKGEPVGAIAGTFLVVGAEDAEGDLTDYSPGEVDKYVLSLDETEKFIFSVLAKTERR